MVDTEEQARRLTRHILGRSFEIDDATSAEEGLDQLQARSYDLLITDLRMSQMDVLTLVTRARALNPDMPCLVLSGSILDSELDLMVRGVPALSKSYLMTSLRFAVGEALSRRPARRTQVRAEQPVLSGAKA